MPINKVFLSGLIAAINHFDYFFMSEFLDFIEIASSVIFRLFNFHAKDSILFIKQTSILNFSSKLISDCKKQKKVMFLIQFIIDLIKSM